MNSSFDDDDEEDEVESLNSEERKDLYHDGDLLMAYNMSDDEREIHRKLIDYERKLDGSFWVYDKKNVNYLEFRSMNIPSPNC